MDCRIINVEQGSDEWLDLRRNRITCSRLADIMSNPKKCAACKGTGKVEGVVAAFEEPCGACKGTGKIQTKRYAQYQREKVREMLGHREQQEETPQWAAHGKEHEPRAIGAYEWRYELDIEHNVFLVSNKYDWLAGSPDMLHKPKFDDGLEIKCRALYKNYKKYRDLAEKHEGTAKACPPENRHQVQGFNMLTGFNRWGYVNYYIGSNLEGGIAQKLHRVWIPRDNTLIAQMEERAKRFIEECYKEAGLL